jgi:hypothetical protein
MLSAPDSTYLLVRSLELARGSNLEQRINEFVDEPVFYWLQGTGGSVGFPDRLGSANFGTATFTNLVSAVPANFGAAGIANFGTGAFASLGTTAFDFSTGQLRTTMQLGANVVVLAPRDPWLVTTWDLIADHRNLAAGWDGINALAPESECLDAAEALAILIAAKPTRARPQFSVDSNGRPSFALYDDRLYLHLTIDGADRLSWYAVSGGTESFEDDIVFDGTQLPPQLDQLL